MGLGLYKKRFNMQLETRSVPEIIEQFKLYENAALDHVQLKTTVKDDGSLRMKFRVRSRYTPPKLHGRITDEYGKVSLQGIVKESFVEGFTYWMFLFLSVFMALISVIVLMDSFNWLVLLICGGGAAAFALIAYSLGKLRRINFNMDEALLMDCIEQILLPFRGEIDDMGNQKGEQAL